VSTGAERHRHAAGTHEEAAARHEGAVLFWLRQGDHVRADLERRNAAIEWAAAVLERDRAALDERDAGSGS